MAKYLINYLDRKSHINKNIYGHFCEHLGRLVYDGVWVGKDSPIPNINGVRADVIEALRKIRVPIMRWPGGCFADTYHWRDGVGPQSERKNIANRYWGATLEDNSFGTDEFMDFCKAVGAGAYVSGNLGSGTIREMVEWAEYIHDKQDTPMAQLRRKNGHEEPWKLAAFGVGNEVWGCGGQMRPEFYADQFRQASHFVSLALGGGMGAMLNGGQEEPTLMIASGPNADDYNFTDKFMDGLTKDTFALAAVGGFLANGMSLHYYSWPIPLDSAAALGKLKTADDFDVNDWYYLLNQAARMDEIVTRHDQIMSKYDPGKFVGLMVDEWGSWYRAEPGTNPAQLFQQNTMRDAVLAGLTLNIFNKHSDRVHLTTIAQMVNVLQSIILTEGDKMLLTPTYHVYDMYKDHMDATLLGTFVEKKQIGTEQCRIDNIFESCSVDAEGNMLCTLTNTSIDTAETIDATLYGTVLASAEATILCADPHAKNTFDAPDTVCTKPWTATVTENGFTVELPAASVVSLKLRVK